MLRSLKNQIEELMNVKGRGIEVLKLKPLVSVPAKTYKPRRRHHGNHTMQGGQTYQLTSRPPRRPFHPTTMDRSGR